MKKITIKNAFSLAEMMIIFALMGVLAVVGMDTINSRTADYFSRYINAKDAIDKAVENTFYDTVGDDGEAIRSVNYVGRQFPKNSLELCGRISEYINFAPIENPELDSSIESEVYNDETYKKYKHVCTPAKEFDDLVLEQNRTKDTRSAKDKLVWKFTSTNNNVFYFTPLRDLTVESETASGVPDDRKDYYFLIFVDLNGGGESFKPNTFKSIEKDSNSKRAKLKPDIVPFVATTRGEVVPVGYPVYDKTYMTARVKFSSAVKDKSGYPHPFSKSYTYDEARQIAYGHAKENLNFPKYIDFYKYLEDIKDRNTGKSVLVPGDSVNDPKPLRCLGVLEDNDIEMDDSQRKEIQDSDETCKAGRKPQAICAENEPACVISIDKEKKHN